jgi:UDP-N-acetylmuramoyl-tripeptide--D-alanyl-D-alanine ligase
VSYCHAENFPLLKDIAKAKAEIFSHESTVHKLYHRPIEMLLSEELSGAIPFDLNAKELPFTIVCEQGCYYFYEQGRKHDLGSIPFREEHLLHNLLAALAGLSLAGVPIEKVLTKISQLKLPEKRFQLVQKQGALYVNDAYNASPESMKAALKSLPKPIGFGKRIGVLGSMKELGKFSENCHREVGKFSLQVLDELICFGKECAPLVDEWKKAGREVYFTEDFNELKSRLSHIVKRDDVVLLKGSNSNQLWKLVEE